MNLFLEAHQEWIKKMIAAGPVFAFKRPGAVENEYRAT
jgi:hypothetical protein